MGINRFEIFGSTLEHRSISSCTRVLPWIFDIIDMKHNHKKLFLNIWRVLSPRRFILSTKAVGAMTKNGITRTFFFTLCWIATYGSMGLWLTTRYGGNHDSEVLHTLHHIDGMAQESANALVGGGGVWGGVCVWVCWVSDKDAQRPLEMLQRDRNTPISSFLLKCRGRNRDLKKKRGGGRNGGAYVVPFIKWVPRASGLLHKHWGNRISTPLSVDQAWGILI